ncbi:hypothetical protein GTB64_004448 [Salmonella enterica]|nr:hypothetical protein [Salmonella enterica]
MPILFLKASGAARKYANMPGYVKIKGHWQRANKELKTPAGAPKAAHPEAHAKGKPFEMPQEHVSQMLYPPEKAASNHEMKNFNEKHVPNLLSHAKEGDVTAILGHKYGTNTHAKKLVALANHLLEQMGSTHKVNLGQQAGEHEAISKHPKAAGEQGQAEAEKTPQEATGEASEAPKAEAKEEAKEAVAAVADAIEKPLPEAKAEKPAPAPKAALTMPAFMSGKQSKGVRTAYEAHAQKILDAVKAKDVGALQALVNPNAGAWKGKTSNSQMLLGLYGQALAKLQQGGSRAMPSTDEPSPVAAVETLAATTAQPKPTAKVNKKAVDAIDWASYITPDNIKSSKGYNKQIDAIKAAANGGDVYGILAMKYGTNTYAKKSVAAANAALIALGHPDLKVVTGKDAVHPLLAQLPQPSEAAQAEQATAAKVDAAKEKGHKNGDTRMGKNGMQVLKDGHWHNVENDEPAPEGDKPVTFKAGQQVTPQQVIDLPAGTVIQTYDDTGKPTQKFLLGHSCAWFISSKGKPLKKPLPKGNYLSLVGLEPSKTNKYENGYHAIAHPSTLESVGKDWVSPQMKATLKQMHPGAKAMGVSNVYSLFGGEFMLVTNPTLHHPAGIIVTDQGDWFGAQALANGWKDPTYAAIMTGQTPDAPDLSAKLGLVPDVTANLPEPPEHDQISVNGNTKIIMHLLAEGDYPLADGYIGDCAEILKNINDGSEASLNVMNWLVHAKTKAHEGIQAAPKPPIEPVPAPAVEPAKMTPLPHFENVKEFEAWKQSDEGEKWLDEGELFYGGSTAWDNAPEAKAWDKWQEKLIAHEKEVAEKEYAEAQAKKKAKPKMQPLPTFEDPEAFNKWASSAKGLAWVEKGIEHYGSEIAFAASPEGQAYDAKAEEHMTWQAAEKEKYANAKEGDTRMGKNGLQKLINGHWVNMEEEQKATKPVKPTQFLGATWGHGADEVAAALESGDMAPIETQIFLTDGLNGEAAQTLNTYAKAAKAWLNSKAMNAQTGKDQPPKPDLGVDEEDWAYLVQEIKDCAASGNLSDLEDVIIGTDGMVTDSGKALHQWAKDTKAWLTANGTKHSEATIAKDLDAVGSSPVAQYKKAIELATSIGTARAWNNAVEHFKEKGWNTMALKLGVDAVKALGIPANLPKPNSIPTTFENTLYEAVSAITYLDDATAKSMMAHKVETLKSMTSPEGVELYDYMVKLNQHLTGEVPHTPPDVEGDLMAQMLADSVEEGTLVKDDEEPQEGDMKPGKNGGMLMLKNGHWVKMFPDDIPVPEFTGTNKAALDKRIEVLREMLKEHGGETMANAKLKITEHKTGKKAGQVTVIISNMKASFNKDSENPDFKAFLDYTLAVKAWLAKAKKETQPHYPKASPSDSPLSAANSNDAGQIEYNKLPQVSGWEKVGGQKGSNEGESLKDDAGQVWYVKYPKDEQHAQAEVLAAAMYSAMGFKAQDAQLVMKNGKLGIASRWIDGLKQGNAQEIAAAKGTLDGFLVDVWLGNRDVIGTGYDNLKIDADGNGVRVDAGASFMYRAQGEKKEFTNDPVELETMLDPAKNSYGHAVFKDMTEADYYAAAARLADMPEAKIRIMVNAMGPGSKADRKKLADTLIARRAAILKQYPLDKHGKPMKAMDPTALEVPPDRLPEKYDFINWNGEGHGLSSKAAVNQSNQKAIDDIYALSLTGNLTALKEMTFQPINVETGEPVGERLPMGHHPSKHVQAYIAIAIQTLDEIANPPQALKIFHEIDINSVEELDAAFPNKPFGTTVASVSSTEKVGFWVALGRMAKKDLAKVVPKKNVSFTASAISSAYDKYKTAGKLVKAFINGIQKSGDYNDLFREGKEKDFSGNDLKDVALAALDYATEQPEGTTLYRWQKMTHDEVKRVMECEIGTVFSTVGSMCTSRHPTNTEGFGPHRLTIRYAKGAKAVESYGSGSFHNEQEVTTLPGGRFVILKKQMTDLGKGQPSLDIELLMLPPEMGL